MNGQLNCKLFIFPDSSLKLFHHFFPTTDSHGTTVYVDQTAIPNLPCPEFGFDYWFNDIAGYSYSIANSWQECGKVIVLIGYLSKTGRPIFCYTAKRCKSNLQCYFWTWNWNYDKRLCYLKNSYGLKRRYTNNKRISGSKECQGKHKWISIK